MQEPMEWVDQHPTDVLTLDIYPSATSSYELYEDDGATMDYTRNICSRTRFTSDLTADCWTFTAARPEGKFIPSPRRYVLTALLEEKPSFVSENGTRLPEGDAWSYDEATHRLRIRPTGNSLSRIVIEAHK
jgi:hypothetical protein